MQDSLQKLSIQELQYKLYNEYSVYPDVRLTKQDLINKYLELYDQYGEQNKKYMQYETDEADSQSQYNPSYISQQQEQKETQKIKKSGTKSIKQQLLCSAMLHFTNQADKKQAKFERQMQTKYFLVPLDQLKDSEINVNKDEYEAKRYSIQIYIDDDLEPQVLLKLEEICKDPEQVLDSVIKQIQSTKIQAQTLPKFQHKKQRDIKQPEVQRMQLTQTFDKSARIYDEWYEKQQSIIASQNSQQPPGKVPYDKSNEEFYEVRVLEEAQKLKEKNERRLELIKYYQQYENRSQISIKKHDFSSLKQKAERGLQIVQNVNDMHFNALTLNLLQGYNNQYTLDDKLLDQFEKEQLQRPQQKQYNKSTNQLCVDGRKKQAEKLIKMITEKNERIKQLIQMYNDEKPAKIEAKIKEYKEQFIEKKQEEVEKEFVDVSPVEKRIQKQEEFIKELQTRMDKISTDDIIKLHAFYKAEQPQDVVLEEIDKREKKKKQDEEDVKGLTFIPTVTQAGHEFKNDTKYFVKRFEIQEIYRVKKIDTMTKKHEEKVMSQCTFKPEVSEQSQKIAKKQKEDIFTRLQKHSQAKILVRNQLDQYANDQLNDDILQ